MSPSPARRNKEPPPLFKEMIQNAKKTRCEIESASDFDVEMETDEALDYSKKFMSMMDNIINRLNKIEEEKKNEDQPKLTNESFKSQQNERDIINKLIAKNEELTRQIEELHKIIAGQNNGQAPRQQTYAERPSKDKENLKPMRQINPLPPPPNKFINFLKQGNVLIRVKDEGEKPFQNVGAEQIAKKVEEALEKVQASVNGEKITIKSVIKYKSGDIRFFTKNKAQANWILENRHTWTHFADPLFITSQALFPVLLHSVPIFFNVEDETTIQEFCEENFIPRDNIKKLKWIGDPLAQQKSNGSMIMHLSDKELARELIKGNLAYKRTHIKPSTFQAGPPQCYNCLKIGPIAHFCKNKPTCANCEKDHNTKSYNKANSEGQYVRCVKADLDAEAPIEMNNDKYFHSAFSRLS
ncbi:hypothetical protein O181_020267 [Austropuccinia psidii MF-1]|uniref:CCHC-type domain-containing protein n=1 Tax=Austropuccinia psidii MF-1 TaxID=1389203 RepID=A0A9Q3GV63_9BASI|nr:hypothetical protein [Austropuccinia psidii MF-1]